MLTLASYRIRDWPFNEYKYIDDLIDFEGPILVHYSKDDINHALYYWIEGSEKLNRWLCFSVSISELYDYLFSIISLYDLIKNKSNELFFTVDIDQELKYNNFQMLFGYSLPDEYFPDIESYYTFEVNEFYNKLFNQLDKDYHIEVLRKHSIHLRYACKNSIYGDTVSAEEAGSFLINISSSFKSFGSYHFFNKFKNDYSDVEELSRTTKKIAEAISPRISNAMQHSFEVSLITETTKDERILKKFKVKNEYEDFRKEITEKYSNEVLTIDYNNVKNIEDIINKYDNFSRKKIFEPVIKIINNPKYQLSFIDKKRNVIKELKHIKFENKEKIIPKRERENISPELKKILVTITLEVNENKDLSTISTKDLREGTLFSKFSNEAEQEIDKITTDNYEITFAEPITINYRLIEGNYEITFDPLEISIISNSKNNAFETFINTFVDIFERDFLSKSPRNNKFKNYLELLIKDISKFEK
jgi:hypothetical protein